MEELARELNVASARLARIADEYTEESRQAPLCGRCRGPHLSHRVAVAGCEQSRFCNVVQTLVDEYYEAVSGLVEGGSDLILIETIFDTLNAKAAIYATQQFFEDSGIELPIMISGTITDASGRTLSGQTTEAFYNSVAHAKPISIGLNCALGADALRPYVEELSNKAETYVSAHPNAGLPNEFGEYDQTPEEMAEIIEGFAEMAEHHRRCWFPPGTHYAIANAVAKYPPRQIPERPKALRLAGRNPLPATKTPCLSTWVSAPT